MSNRRRQYTSIQHADAYRGYGAALRLLPAWGDSSEATSWLARIAHRLYDAGHAHWLILCALPVDEFARAFDGSRAKAEGHQ